MTNKETKPRSATAVRFDPETYEQLRVAADERGVSMNWLVNRAVQDFLPRLVPAHDLKLTRD